MTDTDAADIAQRLTDLAERVRKVASGETDAHIDNILAESVSEWTEPWRYNLQTERLQIVLDEGMRLIDEMQALQYTRLPQEVRDADAVRHAEARERARVAKADRHCPVKHRERLTSLGCPADIIDEVVEACATA